MDVSKGDAVSEESIREYEEAVRMLNTMQCKDESNLTEPMKLQLMFQCLEGIGVKQTDLDKLNVIHVSGTKGKGSTCTFCDSILRQYGFKTGFYSSPHLVEVRERFRINGVPLEREKFTKYFWEVFDKINDAKVTQNIPFRAGRRYREYQDSHNLPAIPCFGFLTIMGLHVFMKEGVDVAIIEVGIGGQYDCTNVFRNPYVCGITSLALDHVAVLGSSIGEIAGHKAGILKPGVPAFTVSQDPEAMVVLKQRAAQLGCKLSISPEVDRYDQTFQLGIAGKVQWTNASLAVQLANAWMIKHAERKPNSEESTLAEETVDASSLVPDAKIAEHVKLTDPYRKGLAECTWLGRHQVVKAPGVTFYLDGAHTVESIQHCVDWFSEMSINESQDNKSVYRVLIYNNSEESKAVPHLRSILKSIGFDEVVLAPIIVYMDDRCPDSRTMKSLYSTTRSLESAKELALMRTNNIQEALINFTSGENLSLPRIVRKQCISEVLDYLCGFNDPKAVNEIIADRYQHNGVAGKCAFGGGLKGGNEHTGFSSVMDNSKSIEIGDLQHMVARRADGNTNTIKNQVPIGKTMVGRHVQVLVTGSLHLVGAFLRVLRDRKN